MYVYICVSTLALTQIHTCNTTIASSLAVGNWPC